MNIYKEFIKNNPGVILEAKASKSKSIKTYRDKRSCCLLAEKAEQTAIDCFEKTQLEKAMYYYSKASRWYAAANDSQWETMLDKTTAIAKLFH